MTDELSFSTVADLQDRLRRRELSSVELTRHFLDRLARFGPRYNALASLTRERALLEADAADSARRRGMSGPLLGIPYGAKDILAARGAATTYGSRAFTHRTPEADASAVAGLTDAGAVLIGKLAMLEFLGFGAWSADASAFGPAKNPWNRRYWASGSSSGSAAAVAAGLAPFTLGSETGGSIAGPAAACGVTGLRPTYGLVSRFGALPLSWTMDKIGPLARTAWDCALVLEAIAGPDLRDRSTHRGFHASAASDALRTVDGMRMGWSSTDIQIVADERIRPALVTAIDDLVAIGLSPLSAELPAIPYNAAYYLISSAEGAAALGPTIDSPAISGVVSRTQLAYLKASTQLLATDYINAMRVRVAVRRAFVEMFESVDVIVSYTSAEPPNRLDEDLHSEEELRGNASLIVAANLAGLPGMFLPCGFTTDGLPIGIQLVGPPFSEGRLLAIGMAYQSATTWHLAHPPDPS